MTSIIGAALPYRSPEKAISSSSYSVESDSSPVDAVIFAGISLVLGTACRHLFNGTRVPYTVVLLVIGIVLGSLGLIYSCSIVDFELTKCFSIR